MTYRLFVDSSNGVNVLPEFDYTEQGEKMETVHRTDGGREYRYSTGSFESYAFTVKYVDSAFKSIVNSWWLTDTDLLFMKVGESWVSSVHITNPKVPINKAMEPYDDQFQGKITLETF